MEKPQFGPKFFQELAIDNPLGIEITPSEAEAWWHWVAWPRYKTYRYRSHKRAVRRWWARISTADLQKAHRAQAASRLGNAADAQEKLVADNAPVLSADVRAALSAMFGGG